jgi:glycerate kinase
VPHLVAAPDKFRGTATAHEAAAAMCAGARRAGWTAIAAPMSDGGEGFLDVLGGTRHQVRVRGPLGHPLDAQWSLLEDGTAIIESARAAGRALLPRPRRDDPLDASTFGVGQLVAAAAATRPSRIVIGCGGTSSTDGGQGCLEALDAAAVTISVPLVVACDVDVAFTEAPARFGPQKGATRRQVAELEERLEHLASSYLDRFGVDVRAVPGAGAGGGLAGAFAALGADLVAGAQFVATLTGLDELVAAADLVATGEGRLDAGSLRGKVVGTVLARAPGLPALVVAGGADRVTVEMVRASRAGNVEVLVLDPADQLDGAPAAIGEATRTYLFARGSG